MSDRKVVYSLDVEVANQARATLRAFGAELQATQAKVASATSQAMQSAVGGIKTANKSIAAAMAERDSIIARQSQSALDKENEFYAKRAEALKRFLAAKRKFEQEGGSGGASKETSTEFAKASAEWAKMLDAHAKMEEKKTAKVLAESKKRADAELRAATAAEKAAERASMAAEKSAQKKAEAEEKATARALAAAQKREQAEARAAQKAEEAAAKVSAREAERLQRQGEAAAKGYETLSESARNARRETAQAGLEMLGSVMQLSRGFVALGLVGEKDLQKITDSLLKVQAAFDITSGAAKIIIGIDKVMQGLQKSTLAAAAAQEALNLAQARGVATGGVSGATNAVGGVAAGGLAGVATSRSSQLMNMARQVTAPAVGLVGRAVPYAARAAGPLALAVGGYELFQGVRRAQKQNIGFGESASEIIGNSALNPMSLVAHGFSRGINLAKWMAGYDPNKKLSKQESIIEETRQRRDMLDAMQGEAFANQMAITQRRNSVADQRRSMLYENPYVSDAAKQAAAGSDATSAKAEMDAQVTAMKELVIGTRERTEAEQKATMAADRAIELHRTRLGVERQITEQARARASAALDEAKTALSSIRQQIEERKNAMRSGEERFGRLSEGERANVVSLKQRFDRGEKLTNEELTQLEGYTSTTDVNVGERFRQQGMKDFAKAGFGAEAQQFADAPKFIEQQLQDEVDYNEQKLREIEETSRKNSDMFLGAIDSMMATQSDTIIAGIKELEDRRTKEMADAIRNLTAPRS